jgi:DeoR/GlpR family transcriptional regulator of sugar metabolism
VRPLERRRAILDLVHRQGDLSVDEACRKLALSPATIRRDFALLTSQGLVQKAWGGLRRLPAGATSTSEMIPSGIRQGLHQEEKSRIARSAAAHIEDGDVVLIDGGTTTLCLAPYLADRPVRILTNSILMAHRIDQLRTSPQGAEVFLTGGFLYPASGLLVGPEAVRSIESYHAGKAFLSVGGLDAEGATNTNQMVVESERAMLRQAQKVFVLADSSKWQRREMVRAFSWEEVGLLITDPAPLESGTIPVAREVAGP